MSSSQQPSGSLTLFFGVAGALASFGLATWLIATLGHPSGDTPVDDTRIEKKEAVATEQTAPLAKYGLTSNSKAVFEKASQAILARAEGVSKVIVPGSPTALAQSAPAPAKPGAPAAKPGAPVSGPAKPAPATPAPAKSAAPAPTAQSAPTPPAPAKPAPAPTSAPAAPAAAQPAPVPAPAPGAPTPAPKG